MSTLGFNPDGTPTLQRELMQGAYAAAGRTAVAVEDTLEWRAVLRISELEAENAILSAHQCTGSDHGCPITAIEAEAGGKYWQMGKGRILKGEPLFGAAIIEPLTNKIIAIGEADDLVSAIRNMRPAAERQPNGTE